MKPFNFALDEAGFKIFCEPETIHYKRTLNLYGIFLSCSQMKTEKKLILLMKLYLFFFFKIKVILSMSITLVIHLLLSLNEQRCSNSDFDFCSDKESSSIYTSNSIIFLLFLYCKKFVSLASIMSCILYIF